MKLSIHVVAVDALHENLGKATAQECKKSASGWHPSVKNVFAPSSPPHT